MPEEDILMDMHQMICVGAYGGVTSAVSRPGCLLPMHHGKTQRRSPDISLSCISSQVMHNPLDPQEIGWPLHVPPPMLHVYNYKALTSAGGTGDLS